MRALYKSAFMLWKEECEIAHVTPQSVLLPTQNDITDVNLEKPELLEKGVSLATRVNSGESSSTSDIKTTPIRRNSLVKPNMSTGNSKKKIMRRNSVM